VTIEENIDLVIAGTRVRGLLYPLGQYAKQACDLTEYHPELLPEIAAANTHVECAIEALGRAVAFLNAKLDTEISPHPTTEGKS
jgi:hypothetical protein